MRISSPDAKRLVLNDVRVKAFDKLLKDGPSPEADRGNLELVAVVPVHTVGSEERLERPTIAGVERVLEGFCCGHLLVGHLSSLPFVIAHDHARPWPVTSR